MAIIRVLWKNLLSVGKIAFLAWLTFTVSQAGFSQRKIDCALSIYGSLKIDVCGNNENQKEFVLVMDIGKVNPEDSLFGFNFEINYEPEKVAITDPLYINTLSEYLSDKQVMVDSKNGKVRGYAITMGFIPVYGQKPLIAFFGKWLQPCPDSASFSVSYIEFTDEFKGIVENYKPATLYGEVALKPERIFSTQFAVDSIVNELNFSFDVNLSIPAGSRLKNFELDLNRNDKNITLDSVYSVTNGVEVLLLEPIENGYKIHCNIINDNGSNQVLKVFGKIDETDVLDTLYVRPAFDEECKCIVGSSTDEILIKYTKIGYVFEKDGKNENIKNINIDDVVAVYLIDVLGKVTKLERDVLQNMENLLNEEPNGIYYVVIETNKKVYYKKMIKINY